ncbi:unnamed protein product [Parascedosporium putredinis]|uniref:Tubulin-folding cofactor D C-terminal domain-containing protein n=1 Tax=Parascedosporium putredinis TaxID=1442378 RepID=A0A9P1GU17_9PEZI|nr:unnamed protein product [Parascedosporium putredinis]CAI7987634.1 unnamed protein product [Parascedosporium putredinis]
MVTSVVELVGSLKSSTLRRQELAAEAASRLVISLLPIMQVAVMSRGEWQDAWAAYLRTGQTLIGKQISPDLLAIMATFDKEGLAERESQDIVSALKAVLPSWLDLVDEKSEDLVEIIPRAALTYLILSRPKDRAAQVEEWTDLVRVHSSKLHDATGYFHAVTLAYPICSATGMEGISAANMICEALLQRWATEKDLEMKASLLSSLTQSNILRKEPRRFLGVLMEGLNDYTTTSRGDIGAYLRGASLKAARAMWQSIGDPAPSDDQEWLQRTVSALFLSVLRLASEKLDKVRGEAQKTLSLLVHPDFAPSFLQPSPSSAKYLGTLLRMLEVDCLLPLVSGVVKADRSAWMQELLAGYVTSADSGNENLVITSREMLCEFCEESQEKLEAVCAALTQNLRDRIGQDRLLIPTLEIISFLLNVGLMQQSTEVDARTLTLLTQKASYKSSNVRKLETCIKVYGGVARLTGGEAQVRMRRLEEGAAESKKRLGALLYHPWPRVRTYVIDELWSILEDEGMETGQGSKLKGIDWGRRRRKLSRLWFTSWGLPKGETEAPGPYR